MLALICPENCALLPCLCQGLCLHGWLAGLSSLYCVLTQLHSGADVLRIISQSTLHFIMCQTPGLGQPPCGSLSHCPTVLPLWLPVLPSPSAFHSCLTSANPKGFFLVWPELGFYHCLTIAGLSWAFMGFILILLRSQCMVVNISGVQFVVSTCI